MNFTATRFPLEELRLRHKKCQQLLQKLSPNASGMLIFSRTNIYYLSGTRANGLLWLPRSGEPLLMVRKAEERCRLESPLKNITSFKSYAHIPKICEDFGVPLTAENGNQVGVEMKGLSWNLAKMLESRLTDFSFVPIDNVLEKSRAVKNDYELKRIQECANMQHKALFELIPPNIHPGMNEREISHILWKTYFELGHGGMLRKEQYGSEIFLGSIASGKNSLLPATFQNCTAALGEHPAMPHMGYAGSIWKNNQLLVMDSGFTFEGYHSDMAVNYFAGKNSATCSAAHEQCFDMLHYIMEDMNKLPCLDNLKVQLQETVASIKNKYKLESFTIFAHGVGLSMDEELTEFGTEDLDENTAFVLALHPCIAIKDFGLIGIKSLFTYSQKGLQNMTPLRKEILYIQ